MPDSAGARIYHRRQETPDMTVLYHISDLHVKTSLIGGLHNAKVESLIDLIIKDYKTHHAQHTAVVIITGDLVDSGEKSEYRKCEGFLGKFKQNRIAVRMVPGNHDNGGKFGTDFDRRCAVRFDVLSRNCGFNPGFISKYNPLYPGYAPYNEIFSDSAGNNPVRVIYLNSCCEEGESDFARGTLGMYQLERLESVLSENLCMPVIICMHHKPVDISVPKFVMDLNVEDHKAIKYLINTYNVTAVLYGHQNPEHDQTEYPAGRGACMLLNGYYTIDRQFAYKLVCDNGNPVKSTVRG